MRIRLTSLLLCGMLLLATMTGSMAGRTAAAGTSSPAAVVASTFTIANNILRGGSLSQLAQVYAPTATLVVAIPTGQKSAFHGLPAIEGWYKAFAASHSGIQLKQVGMRSPLPGMVIHYEVAVDASNTVKGRCAHIFAVLNGKIISDDFIVYWGAIPHQALKGVVPPIRRPSDLIFVCQTPFPRYRWRNLPDHKPPT